MRPASRRCIVVNNAGQVSFWGDASGASGTSGIFITQTTAPGTPIINLGPIQGATAPVPGGGTFGSDFDLAVNNSGGAVFSASVNGNDSVHDGLFLFFAGSQVTSIATDHDSVSGDQFNTFGSPVNNDNSSSNNAGHIAVRATLNHTTTQQGLYLFFAGSAPTRKARTGDTAPTGAGGGTLTNFGDPALSNLNELAVQADTSMGVHTLLRYPASGSAVALASSSATDGNGGTFASGADTFSRPTINDQQRVTATGKLSGTNQQGLYLFFAGNPTPKQLAKTGTSAPGGGTFAAGPSGQPAFGDPIINSSGAVVTTAWKTGGQQGLYLFFAGTAVSTPVVTELASLSTPTGIGGSFASFSSPVVGEGSTASTVNVVARATLASGSEGLFLFFAGNPTPVALAQPGGFPQQDHSIIFSSPPVAPPIFPYYAMNGNNQPGVVFVAKTGATGSPTAVFFASLDQDGDGITDSADNCPNTQNPLQTNTDLAKKAVYPTVTADALGDACDPDIDGDRLANYPCSADCGLGVELNATCFDGKTATLNPDCDNDKFIDGVEYFVGTLILTKCSPTTSPDHSPDEWPPDFDNNQAANLTDIFLMVPHLEHTGHGPGFISQV